MAVTSAAPLSEARAAIEERKRAGLHAGMHFTYGDPVRSTTPADIVPGARSVVVALRRYGDDVGRSVSRPGADAVVARYVHRDEYGALAVALEAMAEILRVDGAEAVVVMDDNRLVDRAVAARAGLGWLGRNTMLLHPELGSWTVIGSVVTDADLAGTAEPVPDGCGSCRRCQVECPTGALDEAGVLDANRCLGWLLQAKGRFPVRYRVALGSRIYGCDDCQEACPVNDVSRGGDGGDGAPVALRWGTRARAGVAEGRTPGATVDVVEMLSLSDDELLDRYGYWYIPRRRVEYLRRNALVVLGNIGDPASSRVRAVLREALASASPLVAGHAVWAAGRLGLTELLDEAKAGPGLLADPGGVGDPDGFVAAELDELERSAG